MLIEFCLPVKDEEKILEANARRLMRYLTEEAGGYDWRVVIIVNGSTDKSAEIAGRLSSNDERFLTKALSRGGKGHALKEYFRQSQADILVFMDIDLAVSLESVPGLVCPVISGAADLTIGSRLMPGSCTDRSFWRSFTSRSYNFLSRLLLRHEFTDLQCGFKAIRRTAFDRIYPALNDDQWFFDTELVILARRVGHLVTEMPVNWQENRYDDRKSKVHVFRDAWSFIASLVRLRRRLKTEKVTMLLSNDIEKKR